MNDEKHIPVMLKEALVGLELEAGKWYVDATFGRGGHTAAILAQQAKVIAFDYDQQAIEQGQRQFSQEIQAKQLILKRENFDTLQREINSLQQAQPDLEIAGVLFDFGTSAEQLTSVERGLSFSAQDQTLDMRLDQRLAVTAKDLLAALSAKQLQQLFGEYGGEREARTIAQAIVQWRKQYGPVQTVGELVSLIVEVKRHKPKHIHPATKIFQALRIAVNDELTNIERALPQALEVVQPGGKIVTIAFHEGEDRIVKHTFRSWEKQGWGKCTPKDVLTPSASELEKNPRSRSAKLRIFTKKNI